MKRKLEKKRAKKTTDVFRATHKRLTLFYSGIFSVFLILFVVIVLFILYQVVFNEQERELRQLAEQEIVELSGGIFGADSPTRRPSRQGFLAENQLFYYVQTSAGELVVSNEGIDQLQPVYLDLVSDWTPAETEIKQEAITIPSEDPDFSEFRDFDFTVLALARPIKVEGEVVGTMYIGLDISNISRIFRWTVIVLSGLAVLFIGIGVVLSYIMSKRALVPIQRSYNQQRELVANASHELRTPLSTILSSIEVLELEREEKNPFTKRIMDGLKHEVRRMTILVSDLLTLAQADSPEANALIRKWCNLTPASEQLTVSFKAKASAKKIDLTLEAPAEVNVYADCDKLIQLLSILLDNAINYTPEGGKVTVKLQTKKESLLLSVRDTGIGIAAIDQDRIFERFYRADKARTRKEGGHGLGLSIGKWIVDAHEGTILVESSAGEGSLFQISIPNSDK
ncbi:two component system histidine kinase [Planococcus sp. PAMC 21323]|uniref:sensor histidine kinase n=1 Tax=Planococcus sp. PAMC 21323 TaxID=1526927 RepID=UPI000570769F|nr:ATP-binding protein [Planococcus sp. PAMC 21323]AIY04553.1 two component system histidine kinase [Planococcus sp. PAMC 21323]